MEIEFNPNRYSEVPSGGTGKVSRRDEAQSSGNTAGFERTQALESALKEMPAVRPEKIARARALVADVKYPPDEVLNRIANLLAIHVRE